MPIQFPTTVELSDLNGINGFMLNGFVGDSLSGSCVASAGDINADGIADMIIGAPSADIGKPGQSYVIFGHTNIGNSGVIELSNLNGNNGFTINGVSGNDDAGISVATASDVNNDGINDLIIGAPAVGFGSGQAYVVFGNPNIGSSGTFELSSLNGENGFSLINGAGGTGLSVASAGDINDDGVTDLIVGSPSGSQAYIIFGNTTIGKSGPIVLLNLDGTNGFKMINGGSYTGQSVNSLGDINGDSIDDVIIGAPNASQSYVIFGNKTIGSTGSFDLSILDGKNGCKINGIASNDQSGASVASAGDVNHDGVFDIIIGAPYASPNGQYSGQSYVIFGGPNIGNKGTLELSNLNGKNGFIVNGASSNVNSGSSVNYAGDITNDGFSDLIIGAPNLALDYQGPGQSNIIFGGPTIGSSGLIELSSLNGINGFSLIGSTNENYDSNESGTSVASVGDVNNDGVMDFIIGAPRAGYAEGNSGQSYVIFGDSLALTKNTLSLYQNQTIILTQSNLDATASNYSPTTLQFSISNIQHGQFAYITNPTVPINQFLIQDIIEQKVQFVQDGSIYSPSYKVSISTTGRWASTVPEAADVNFTPCIITVKNSELSLTQGEAVVLNQTNIYAETTYCSASILQFSISDIEHGQFEYVFNPHEAITEFYQQNVTTGLVQFVQDWSIYPPAYKISAFSGASVHTTPLAATIHFGPLLLEKNELTIVQGGMQQLNASNLYATDKDAPDSQISYTIENLQYGQFEATSSPGIAIDHFTQQQVDNNEINFVQDGTPNVPNYHVIVSDGVYTLPPSPSNVILYYLPVLEVNVLSIAQDQTVVFNQNNLKATDKYVAAPDLLFSISAIEHGHFSFISEKSVPITEFTQQQVDKITVQFTQDGSAYMPGYNVTVHANNLASLPQAAIINWTPKPPTPVVPSPPINNTTKNALIGSATAAGVLGSLFLCYMTMGFLRNRRLGAIAKDMDGEQQRFYQDVIIPVARSVFKQIKITGFMNYISSEQMEAYVTEIAVILNELNDLGVNLTIRQMEPKQQTQLLTQIIKQIKHHLNIQSSKCNRTWVTSFFKPQITPEMLGEKAQVIARSIYDALLGKNEARIINLPANVDLTDVIGQTPAEGDFTTGYVQMP